MAQQSRQIIKQYFQFSKRSCRKGFIDLIDSFADIPEECLATICFTAKRTVVYETKSATFQWQTQGIDLLCMEYTKDSKLVKIELLPPQCSGYTVNDLTETTCFRIYGMHGNRSLSRQLWICVIPDTEPEQFMKRCFGNHKEVLTAAQEALSIYPELKPLTMAVALIKAKYEEAAFLKIVRIVYPKITPQEIAELLAKIRNL